MIGIIELQRRKLQFGLIGLVVTLISYLVLMINGLGVGLNIQAGSALQNFNADSIAYSSQAGLSVIRSELSNDTVAKIQADNSARQTAPLGYVAANYQRKNGVVRSAAFFGYDPGTIGEPKLIDGRRLRPDDRTAVLADKKFLRASGLKVGDKVDVSVRLNTLEFTIVGEIDEGAFFFQPALYVLRDTWQQLKYGAATPDQPAASIVLVKGKSLRGKHAGYEVVSKSTAFKNIEGVKGQESTVQALRVFGFLIGALVIAVFFYVITLQKVGHIGVLKAIGASSGFVFRQILVQVFLISLIAVGISIPLAWVTDRGLQQLPDAVPIAFTSRTFVFTGAALIVVGVVGALASGRQVAKVDPIIALGHQQ